MTFINSAKVSVRKLVKSFSKVGLVVIFSIPIFLIFSLVAPKVNAYDETAFTSVSLGQTPLQLIDFARSSQSSAFNSYDTGSYIVYVLNPQIGDLRQCYVYFIPENVLNVSFHNYANNSAWLESDLSFSYIIFNYYILSDNSVSISSSGTQTNRTIDIEKNKLSPNYGNLWSNQCTLTFPDATINPAPVQNFVDDFLVYTSGWLINYNVGCTSQSQHSGWWWFTRRYKCRITATYNNQPIILDIPNYVSWDMNIRTLTSFKLGDSYGSFPDPLSSVQEYYQNISYVNYESPVVLTISTPEREWNSVTDMADTSLTSNMTVSLYQVLQAFRSAYSSYSFSDDWLYQDISFSFIGYDDNKTYYTQVLTYSVVTDRTDAPPDLDTLQPNWFDNRQTVINNINENSTFDYLSKPPERWSKPPRLSGLESIPSIDSPDFSFPDISSLDGSATDFFSWLVNLVVSSPIGLLILIGLGFLVVKAVVHQ